MGLDGIGWDWMGLILLKWIGLDWMDWIDSIGFDSDWIGFDSDWIGLD